MIVINDNFLGECLFQRKGFSFIATFKSIIFLFIKASAEKNIFKYEEKRSKLEEYSYYLRKDQYYYNVIKL